MATLIKPQISKITELKEFDSSLFNSGSLDLTEHLFKELIKRKIKHHRTKVPNGTMGVAPIQAYAVRSHKLKYIWQENEKFGWNKIIEEIYERFCSVNIPIFYTLNSTPLLYDPKDFSQRVGFIVRVHQGFQPIIPRYTIYGIEQKGMW